MSSLSPQPIRLLGFAPLANLSALMAALDAVPGQAPAAISGPSVAAIVQREPPMPPTAGDRQAIASRLKVVQQRLEVACQAGPFLPMHPACACIEGGAASRVLDPAWAGIAAALDQYGGRHQWDIQLRWAAEPVVARYKTVLADAAVCGREALGEAIAAVLRNDRDRREAALLDALTPVVLAFAEGGTACSETEIAVTVLITAGQEGLVEEALDRLPPDHAVDATISMRGPLPPLNFAAVRLASVPENDAMRAWRHLDLPHHTSRIELHQRWRLRAAQVHPDRVADTQDASVADVTAAYHALRDLLPADASDKSFTLNDLVSRAGPRLVMPAGSPVCSPEQVSWPEQSSTAEQPL